MAVTCHERGAYTRGKRGERVGNQSAIFSNDPGTSPPTSICLGDFTRDRWGGEGEVSACTFFPSAVYSAFGFIGWLRKAAAKKGLPWKKVCHEKNPRISPGACPSRFDRQGRPVARLGLGGGRFALYNDRWVGSSQLAFVSNRPVFFFGSLIRQHTGHT